MTPDFRYAVVGRGLTGSAAARHLAEQVSGVVLIGPDEPADWQNHNGVFASHYDEGRITRTIDPDVNWARFANRSIARYRDIEARSGISFYAEKGCLISGLTTGRSQDYVAKIRAAAEALDVSTDRLDDAGLKQRFPYFDFPDGSDAVFEPANAGHISPRRLVAAQTRLTEAAGGKVIRAAVTAVTPKSGYAEITTADGQTLTAAKVLVAAGGFTNGPGLLPERLDLTVYGRTVSFFEVDEREAERLSGMPSMIWEPEDIMRGIYLLPPIRYPDGRYYLKIGGDMVDIPLPTHDDVLNWFRTAGDRSNHDNLVATTKQLMPDLRYSGITRATCVTSYTRTGYPAIGWTSEPAVAVMAGGCGAAAKSSDEIGRLGAELLSKGAIEDPAYSADFAPRFL
jgi:glycine/D-amino acid oxidase-like deaminating enzyme